MVKNNFLESMPNANIISIEMIQDYFLWNSYKLGLEQTHKKSNLKNEKLLWHGTSKTDPQDIIHGSEGFDTIYSKSGLYGKGLYFAVKSIYSDAYAFKFDNKDRGMYLALVNLG